jgi:DNA repair protein RecO (recombination protein O)
MLHKTEGIVLNYIKYKDTSIISKIYTRQFGLQSYIVNGVRSKKAKLKIALFQPLTLLEMVVYYKKTANLNRIAELKCPYPQKSLALEIKKSSIAIFIGEMLYKLLKEETAEEDLFSFLWHSIQVLENQERGFSNFHLQFLLKLARYLGFQPSSGSDIFRQISGPDDSLVTQEIEDLTYLISNDFDHDLSLSANNRNHLLQVILKYYHYHIDTLGEIKSIQILKEVLG